MNKKTSFWIAALAVLLLICGGLAVLSGKRGQNKNHTGTNTPSDDSSNKTEDSERVATNTVSISNFAFSPANITVKKGSTVTWTNQDTVAHTVTKDSDTVGGPGLDSKDLAQGESYSATFNDAGTFKYHCVPHPHMVGTVTVTE